MRCPWILSAIVTVLAVGAPSATAKGTKPAPPPAPAPAPAPPKTLPAGCERLTDGRDHALSLDGKLLAFAKWTLDGSKPDYHGEAIPKPTVFVRTLATKQEAKLAGATGVPVGWTTQGWLCLSTGKVIDPATGKVPPGAAVLPSDVDAEALAWTADGSRVAYAADWTANLTPPAGVPQVLAEVDNLGTVRLFDFGDKVYPGEGGTLAWSADGKRLAFNLPFFWYGHVPPRRTGFVDVTGDPKLVAVAEISQDNGLPGMQEARRPMRPHKGTTGPVLGRHVWNRDGTLLAFVDGGGGGNADVYLFDARTEERLRQTSDGVTKWSPAIDPAGRRVAYLTGKVESFAVLSPRQLTLNPTTLRILDAQLCVLDVVDGTLKTYPIPGDPAYPGNLAWTPDGARVLYEIHGGNAAGTYAQTVPAPAALPDGKPATPRSLVVTPESEAAAALRSGDVRRVRTVCEKREVSLEGIVLAAVREVLPKWAVAEDDRAAYALLRWIQEAGAREALPEIRGALKSPRWTIARAAVRTLVAFDAKETLPELDAVRTGRAEPQLKVAAAAALWSFGDPRGWADFEAVAKHKEADARAAVCVELKAVRDPRAVDLLLVLLKDDGFLYTTTGGDNVVGDRAAETLLELTGVFFRRDATKWTAWWTDEAKRVVPEAPDTSEARAAFDAWFAEREAAHQEKMRKGLPPGFGGK